jgi:uncharacterized protein (TIGR03437 family)
LKRYFSVVFCLLGSASLSIAADFVNGQAARAVIGRYSFDRGDSGVNQQLNGGVSGLAYADGMLFVADSNRVGSLTNPTVPVSNDNRVLMYYTDLIPALHADVSTLPVTDSLCHLCGFGSSNVLGQPDYGSTNANQSAVVGAPPAQNSLFTPTAVATDGAILAVADTDNNRVLIWNSIPTTIDAPANLVLGQPDFVTRPITGVVNAQSLRGPQGVWIQNGKLFVADTQNYRILIWNSIPTTNNQPADLVLGQPNFTTVNAPPPKTGNPTAAANQLLNPVSVTSDGTRVYVSDLGFNRVLIWNSIPTTMGQPADVVVGQPDMTSTAGNNFTETCSSANSVNVLGDPFESAITLNFPRFAISDGKRLYVADGGNDRVLIYDPIPQTNGAAAAVVLGQKDFGSDAVSSCSISFISTIIDNTASVDTISDPQSLALDGTNLYVSDPDNRRVLVFTPGDTPLQTQSVLNWASEIIRQEGSVVISSISIVANDTVTVTINGTNYVYTVKSADTADTIAQGLVTLINASDPNATAFFTGPGTGTVALASKAINLDSDTISLAATASNTLDLTVTASGGYLTAGTAATVAAGTLVEVNGVNLADQTAVASLNGQTLGTSLGGAQVYMDGFAAPLLRVSPNQIIAQVPYEMGDGRASASVYVRTVRSNGSVTATNATKLIIAPANPGIFDAPSYIDQPRPWPAVNVFHQTANPQTIVSIDGSVAAGDVATIVIGAATYTYTVQSADTLETIVTALQNAINTGADPNVTASAGAAFNRVVLTSKKGGAAGTNFTVTGTSTGKSGAAASVTVTVYGPPCCAVAIPGSLVTTQNPAIPGELITVSTTGLGALADPSGNAVNPPADGAPFAGPVPNSAVNTVSATVNQVTGQVVSAELPIGSYGVSQVQVLLPTTLTSNPVTQLYIAQNAFISNTVTIPVGNGPEYLPGGFVPLVPAGPAQGFSTPAILNFGNISNVASQSQTVTLTNLGGGQLTILGITLAGLNPGDFTISAAPTNSCGVSTSLASGVSCSLLVTFTRTAPGTRSASLVFSDNSSSSPTQTVALEGFDVTSFEIINKLSGKALDVVGASTANGGLLEQFDFLDGSNQKWQLVPVDSQYYQILSVGTGKVLDDTGFSTVNGTPIQQWDYTGGDNQKWKLVPVDGGYFAIQNKLSGKVLDVTNYSLINGTLLQQWDYVGGDNQQWLIAPVSYAKIVNKLSGKVLDDSGLSTTNGTIMQQWTDNGGDNQQWLFVPTGGGYQAIKNKLSTKVLDNTNSSTANSNLIQQFDYHAGDNQQWLLVPTTAGYFAIYNKLSGKVLDDTGASLLDGSPIQQYDFTGGDNQQWQIVVVPPRS